jgi:hypothetical protein
LDSSLLQTIDEEYYREEMRFFKMSDEMGRRREFI